VVSIIVGLIGIGVKIWLARKKRGEDGEAKQYDNLSGHITNVHNYGGNFQMNNKANRN
jgi:hypothetical protein